MYPCKRCDAIQSNLLEYIQHLDWHDAIETGSPPSISEAVLQYVMDEDIAPSHDVVCLEWGGYIDHNVWAFDDADVLIWAIREFECEYIAIGILNRLDSEKVGSLRNFDDEEHLREHLLDLGVISNLYEDDIYNNAVCGRFSFEEWEEFCHYTNVDLLMMCIKKGWTLFCLRLLDFERPLYDINHVSKGITTYDLAVKNGMTEVADKIRLKMELELNKTNKL